MKKHNIKLSLALAAMFSSSLAFAEAELTGEIIHESAVFTQSGQSIGATTTWSQTADTHGKDYFKGATHAKIFLDGEFDEGDATYHAELNAFIDVANRSVQDGGETYTQRDLLREAYIDQETEGVSFRVGKQQVVWGTADGMKLLDAINPTDYTEMAQNQMEDSRIPVWMINAEKDIENGGNVQFILSEAKANRISGLGKASGKATSHTNGEAGDAFIMKGVDSISGKVNGFLNVAPALGKVAAFFTAAAANTGAGTATPYSTAIYSSYKGVTVDEFSTNDGGARDFANLNATGCVAATSTSARCLYATANTSATNSGFTTYAMGGNSDVTNLIDANDDADFNKNWDASNPNTAFEYMGEASFATFYNFSNMTSEYRVDHNEHTANIGGRYKGSTSDGLNYSFNFISHEDPNPYVNAHWEDQNGVALTTSYVSTTPDGTADGNCGAQACTAEQGTTIQLQSGGSQFAPSATNQANLVMVEKTNRIESLGGSFDTAIETTELGPVILRGEVLYDKGVMTPIVDLAKLKIGDMTGGLTTQESDVFKYVLGADITALTNMMVSAQFIQIVNLDYVNETYTPSVGGVSSHTSGARYTGDAATMHMSNGFNKAEEFKEFYSLFLSKPFGASNQHRWNNLFMFEENGGKWNRLDAEFAINDDLEATVEYNKYFGDVNTQFGQLEKASNLQIGFNYSF